MCASGFTPSPQNTLEWVQGVHSSEGVDNSATEAQKVCVLDGNGSYSMPLTSGRVVSTSICGIALQGPWSEEGTSGEAGREYLTYVIFAL
jgi:hypothetical protein